MNKKIINYEELEKPINKIETILENYDMEEKALVLKIITQRFGKKIQQQKINDNLNGIKFGGLIKRFIKENKGGEEE